jgi:hypothetical protein
MVGAEHSRPADGAAKEITMRKARARKAPRSEKPRNGPGSSPAAKRPSRYAGRDRQPQGGGIAPTDPATPLSADARELDDPKGRQSGRSTPENAARQGWGLREHRSRMAFQAAPRRPGSLPVYDGIGHERRGGFGGRVGNYGARFEASQLAGIGLSSSCDGEYVGWGRYGLARTR